MRPLTVSGPKSTRAVIRHELRKTEESRYHQRLHAVLLVLKGYDCYKTGKLLEIHPTTIQRWIRDFNTFGLEGLKETHSRGRPRMVTDEQLQTLKEHLQRSPQEFKFEESEWNGKIIMEHLFHEFHVELSLRQCQRILKTVR